MEIVSPLMQGDAGLKAIEEVYDEVRPGFDCCCGLHVHIDVRDLNEQQMFDLVKAFKATKKSWWGYVDSDRHTNRHCRFDLPLHFACTSFDEFIRRSEMVDFTARYRWLNLEAIGEHGSIEIRLHEGTKDVDKVTEWVARLVNFVEDVVNMSKEMITRR